jgi:hypothetical protein
MGGVFILAATVVIAARADTLWDYSTDAGPPVDALAHLRIHEFLADRPIMGPLSIVLRAPFAALGQVVAAGGSKHQYLSDYRFGIFPCLVAAGVFGLVLARMLERRGDGVLARAAVVILAVVNPVSLRAIRFGHPEEILGAVLLAGAMLAALRRRPAVAAVLLGLALVNKQWALIGAPSVLVVLWIEYGWAGLKRPILVFVAVAVLLFTPLLIVDAGSLVNLTRSLSDLRGSFLFPASVWYPFGGALGPDHFTQMSRGLRELPDAIAASARWLIVAMGIALPLLLRRRVQGDVLQRAFPLLALVMLLRCYLDPADNGYYHVPFFMAVLAADAIAGRFFATAVACVVLQLPVSVSMTPTGFNRFYIIWATGFAIYLAGRTWGVDWAELVRSRGARGPAVERLTRSSSSAARTQ